MSIAKPFLANYFYGMKFLIVSFIIILSTVSSLAQNSPEMNAHSFYEKEIQQLTSNLTLLLYRNLSIYTLGINQYNTENVDCKTSISCKSTKPNVPRFVNNQEMGNVWLPLFKVAHETGHSIAKSNNWFTSLLQPWDKELRADYISGYVLGKLGASLQDLRETFKSTFDDTTAHEKDESSKNRLYVLTLGYSRALYNY